MKVAYWPDSHVRTLQLKRFIESRSSEFDKIVLLGDYFDDWHDSPFRNMEMARFLREEVLYNPQIIVIAGNHDNYYRWGNKNYSLLSAGFSWDKFRAINSILREQDWNQFRDYTFIDGWLASHAGFAPVLYLPSIFEGEDKPFDLKYLDSILQRGYELIRKGHSHFSFADGISRGGNAAFGGHFWQDWSELIPLKGIKQIVGHSHVTRPRIRFYNPKSGFLVTRDYYNNKKNPYPSDTLAVNLDTANRYFGYATDGYLTVHRTCFLT